jgi:hypothetical protein
MNIANARVRHLAALWQEGLWGKWIAAIWSAMTIFTTLRDEFFRPGDDGKWKVINLVPHLSPTTWTIGILAVVLIWTFEASFRCAAKDKERLDTYEAESPIEIRFDPKNPRRRFWSIESAMKPDGSVSYNYIEYRTELKNTSGFTVRDVQVICEPTGSLASRPGPGIFDLTKETVTMLHPGETKLVSVLRWPFPPVQAGMLAGPSAREGYGGLRITVNATNTPARIHEFDFDYMREPMLSELGTHLSDAGVVNDANMGAAI